MEVVVIDGVDYVKASQAAKRFKYTSDYIGQLCRGKKIDAKLIGRTWYVNPLSLTSHKTGRYSKSGSDEKTISNKEESSLVKINVEPVPRRDTIKILSDSNKLDSNFAKRIDWKPVKYEADASDLLPNLKMVDGSESKINVDIAESERLVVKEINKPTKLVADQLPTVSLAGSLKVFSIDDDFEEQDFDNTPKNIDISKEIEALDEVSHTKKDLRGIKLNLNSSEKNQKIIKEKEIPESKATYSVDINHSAFPVSFTPKRIVKRVNLEVPSQDVDEEASNTSLKWFFITLFFVSFLVLLSVVFVDIEVMVTEANYVTNFNFSTADFLDYF